MRMRLIGLVLGLLLIPALASADDHRWDWYTGGSGGDGASKLAGIHQAIGIALGQQGTRRKLAVVGDIMLGTGLLFALRAGFPEARLMLLVRPQMANLAPLLPPGVTLVPLPFDPRASIAGRPARSGARAIVASARTLSSSVLNAFAVFWIASSRTSRRPCE